MRDVLEPAEEPLRPDFLHLHESLRVLASPVRLQILWSLRAPAKPGDLQIHAPDAWGGRRAGRLLGRTTVLEHLASLEDLGLVRRIPEDGTVVVDQQMIFRVVKDLGLLARLRPLVELDVNETVKARPEVALPLPDGPKLVHITGPEAGRAFALRGDGPWHVGRASDADVRIAYDPHVSRVHAVVTRSEDGLHWVEALAGATNPVHLDFVELPPAVAKPLVPGSVLDVGSSRFVLKTL